MNAFCSVAVVGPVPLSGSQNRSDPKHNLLDLESDASCVVPPVMAAEGRRRTAESATCNVEPKSLEGEEVLALGDHGLDRDDATVAQLDPLFHHNHERGVDDDLQGRSLPLGDRELGHEANPSNTLNPGQGADRRRKRDAAEDEEEGKSPGVKAHGSLLRS